MLSNCTSNLLNLKEVKIKIKHYDYHIQSIKDLPIQFKNVNIILGKCRYVYSCGKKFFECYDFLPRYKRITNRLAFYIITEFKKTKSMKEISSITNVSTSTVMRLFNYVNYGMPKLPTVLSIDELKGNTNAGKHQCILVDGEKKKGY